MRLLEWRSKRTLLEESWGRYFSLRKSDAYLRRTVLTRVLCTSQRTDTEGSTLASSVGTRGVSSLARSPDRGRHVPSIARIAEVKEAPAPPYSTSVSIAMS